MTDTSNTGTEQLQLLSADATTATAVAGAGFDSARLTQARRLAGLTKKAVADQLGVSPVAVGQWEAGTHPPRPDHIVGLAEALDVPAAFLAAGRPYARLEASSAHFRSLRRTPAIQRAKAIAFTEQVWELTYALEKRIQLPPVDLPGFSAGEIATDAMPSDPARAAQELRRRWDLGTGRIPQLVRTMEHHGLIVTLAPFAGAATATVDAFSTSHLPRPMVALTPDRADDVYRHRFTAAHELGHLVLHGDTVPGDTQQEKEADQFAAELLTPAAVITPLLPARMDFKALDRLSKEWGVAVESLVYRCREVGKISEPAYRRAFQRLAQLRKLNLFQPEPVAKYPGENPLLLRRAFELAEKNGLTLPQLADELKVKLPRLRLLLGVEDPRPRLRLV
ncbi:XRE family transcriptional regulator [Kribbella sp. NPDC050820]|uniref:helix-turn-helix domain-containing protein n=1 Tax=Kribbella sp. NPDC050820 TaxID=3155408 RepID=UPI0033DC7E39